MGNKKALRHLFTSSALLLAAATGLSACESAHDRIVDKENSLAAAGFVARPADNAERQTMLQKLPPNRFLQKSFGDHMLYIYSDPKVCNCLYVGNQAAYGRYMSYVQAQNLADQQQMTADTYQDASWNWGMWGWGGGGWGGPWGGGWW
ncbi:hypothetical protein CD178_01458 [Komagataeibacter saccharivorans]|uniref:Uncharacterized protein n=1 Tax=Komagataeibacter saccharivorans TaxID=265959 RepID=A0A347WBJ2_9PROT|nr:hypothetical protein [Komagataeibacter saccharivorans]AXY22235.1 hypothetical protein CD178_01458 [Komagataeibacter saccharivorans]QBL93834.1 hypothetical protein KSAC_16100 [Komagataeibacter saccharivorans]GBQ40211.1 hypothetical protein AA0614_1919 [Komagataeibacter saccharivorans NRIC 0614]